MGVKELICDTLNFSITGMLFLPEAVRVVHMAIYLGSVHLLLETVTSAQAPANKSKF